MGDTIYDFFIAMCHIFYAVVNLFGVEYGINLYEKVCKLNSFFELQIWARTRQHIKQICEAAIMIYYRINRVFEQAYFCVWKHLTTLVG